MASDLDSAVATIETTLEGAFPALPIAFANAPFKPPSTGNWLDCTVIWGDTFVTTMAPTNRNTAVGVVMVGVQTPLSIGAGAAYRLADTVRDLYNRKEIAGVRFGAASGPRRGPLDSLWHRVVVSVPFTVDELVP